MSFSKIMDDERARRRRLKVAIAAKWLDALCLVWAGVITALGDDPTPVLLIWIGGSLAGIRRIMERKENG